MKTMTKVGPLLIALSMAGAGCGGSEAAPVADARAEGVAGSEIASNSVDGTSDDTTTATTTTPDESPASTVAEPAVTVPPSTAPPVPAAPPLQRVEPIVVPLDFDGQQVTEVTTDIVPGAGRIAQFGEIDVYRFEAAKGQAFVLEELGGCSFDGDDDFMGVDIKGAGSTAARSSSMAIAETWCDSRPRRVMRSR